MEFNTVTISDGITMGTEGMKASLISREVIADSIELVARGNSFDGIVCIAGCDKNMPAAIMALGRLDIPGLMLYGGSIAPGQVKLGPDGKPSGTGKLVEITILQVFEGMELPRRRHHRRRAARSPRSRGVPRPRSLRRPVHRQHHGHGRRVSSASPPSTSPASPPCRPTKQQPPAKPASLVMQLARTGLTPRKIVTPRRPSRTPTSPPAPPEAAPTPSSTCSPSAREFEHPLHHRRLQRHQRPHPAHLRHVPRRQVRRHRLPGRRRLARPRQTPHRRRPTRRLANHSTPARPSTKKPPTPVETTGKKVIYPINAPLKSHREASSSSRATSPPTAA